jgi:hypothetical protein
MAAGEEMKHETLKHNAMKALHFILCVLADIQRVASGNSVAGLTLARSQVYRKFEFVYG